MEHSPFDIEGLVRLANEIFRGAGGDATHAEVPSSGPVVVSSQAINLSPDFEHERSALHSAALGAPMSAAVASATRPPERPAFGRPLPDPDPHSYTKYMDTTPTNLDEARHMVGSPPISFDPHLIPGFAAIPDFSDELSVERVFDRKPVRQDAEPVRQYALSPLGYATTLAAPFDAIRRSGLPHPTKVSGPIDTHSRLDLAGGAKPSIGDATRAGVVGLSAPASIFGHEVYSGLEPSAVPNPVDQQQSFVNAPTPGHSGGPGLASPFRTPDHVVPAPRTIDHPTPSHFTYQDIPHLGEFEEEPILAAAIAAAQDVTIETGLPSGSTRGLPTATASEDVISSLVYAAAKPNFYFEDRGLNPSDTVPHLPGGAGGFSVDAICADFPVLHQNINGYPLVWLDNGATTQKPKVVIDRISRFYERENSNINRSAHELAARATDAYEDARHTVRRFLNAPTIEEIVFVRGTTEGINFVAQSFGRRFIKYGDEIILTHAEHHANIVPWYLLANEVGAKLKVVPFDDKGEILLDRYEEMLNDRVKIVAMTHVSNALGTVLPAKAMTEMAHRRNIPVLLDGAQSISHMPIDVQDIDCDFFVFSGHKVFGPTGIGAVYGKRHILDGMPPWQGGGNMIKDVTFEHITFQEPPGRFEAGTGNIADAIGLAEALRYLERIGMQNIALHEHAVLTYATEGLSRIKGLRIIGQAREKAGVISFLLEGKEAGAVGKALNRKGIAVRAGHHCALPILRRYGVEATVRPAFAIYNTFHDADRLIAAIEEIASA